MPRNAKQWLEMIAQTQPSTRAADALAARLSFESQPWSAQEFESVQNAITDLRKKITTTELSNSNNPRINIEYRDHGDAARGRLYLEVIGLQQANFLADPVLDNLQIYLFMDGQHFAGLQVDAAKALADRLTAATTRLKKLNLPSLDCEEAGLQHATIGSILNWAWQNRILAER